MLSDLEERVEEYVKGKSFVTSRAIRTKFGIKSAIAREMMRHLEGKQVVTEFDRNERRILYAVSKPEPEESPKTQSTEKRRFSIMSTDSGMIRALFAAGGATVGMVLLSLFGGKGDSDGARGGKRTISIDSDSKLTEVLDSLHWRMDEMGIQKGEIDQIMTNAVAAGNPRMRRVESVNVYTLLHTPGAVRFRDTASGFSLSDQESIIFLMNRGDLALGISKTSALLMHTYLKPWLRDVANLTETQIDAIKKNIKETRIRGGVPDDIDLQTNLGIYDFLYELGYWKYLPSDVNLTGIKQQIMSNSDSAVGKLKDQPKKRKRKREYRAGGGGASDVTFTDPKTSKKTTMPVHRMFFTQCMRDPGLFVTEKGKEELKRKLGVTEVELNRGGQNTMTACAIEWNATKDDVMADMEYPRKFTLGHLEEKDREMSQMIANRVLERLRGAPPPPPSPPSPPSPPPPPAWKGQVPKAAFDIAPDGTLIYPK